LTNAGLLPMKVMGVAASHSVAIIVTEVDYWL
jgi:hypothetical protein